MSWSSCMPLHRLLLGAMSITAYEQTVGYFTIGDSTYTVDTRVFSGLSIEDADENALSVGDLITDDSTETVVKLLCDSDWCFIPMPENFINAVRPMFKRSMYLPYVGASLYQLSDDEYIYSHSKCMVQSVFCMCRKRLINRIFPSEELFCQNAYCVSVVDGGLSVSGLVGRNECNLILPEDCQPIADKVAKELSTEWNVPCMEKQTKDLPLLRGLLDTAGEENRQRLFKALQTVDQSLPAKVEAALSGL